MAEFVYTPEQFVQLGEKVDIELPKPMNVIGGFALMFKDDGDYCVSKSGKFITVSRLDDAVEHRKGKWVKWGSRVKCDQCNLCNSFEKPYCPNCGADMREES